ncbi:cupredoxin domain-containing protein [Microaerobacter geothermalis]|uniref:cupredoxin domain-containing protein n=1 Tax=Microaerobacter geothermalis TaxID=674972 RepID=UPI001F226577|nr:cupredoxin domain-containing protein [Microaerobacter geothermalis]MCF6094105.1 cupredoxin domain-containing protein [Microaerobacter geothermalis]
MTVDQILVTLGGVALIIWIVWYFFFSTNEGQKAKISADGVQEVFVTVKGGYTPDVVVVEAGRPVRFHFRREETASCSERVVFGDFNKSAILPTNETVTLEIKPETPGEYAFTCQMGMFRGKMIVE